MPLVLKHTDVGTIELQSHPIPTATPGHLIVKTTITGGNPVEAEVCQVPVPNSTAGYDFSGHIHSLPPSYSGPFAIGDRVTGFTFGCTPKLEVGGHAEYVVAYEHLTMKIPEVMSDEDAVTLPVGLAVAAAALVKELGVTEGDELMILGGASTMGAIALQVGKALGAKVVVTASSKNSKYLKSLGADEVVDYTIPEDDQITTLNTLTSPQTRKILYSASTPSFVSRLVTPSTIVVLLNPPAPDLAPADYRFVNIFDAFGDEYVIFGNKVPANPEFKKFIEEWMRNVGEKLVAEGKVKPHRVQVVPGGLGGVKEGWELYRQKKVSGVKLVYRVAETEGAGKE